MRYVDQQLMPDERVIFRTTLHPAIFIWPVIIAFILLFAGLPLLIGHESVGLWLVLIAGLVLLRPFVLRATCEFAVTNKRIIGKIGALRHRTIELLLQKVETIAVDQTLFGRMLGYGTTTIRGTGGTPEVFTRIADPLGLRRAVNEQLVAGAPSVAGA